MNLKDVSRISIIKHIHVQVLKAVVCQKYFKAHVKEKTLEKI